jgi:hypothetical protein
MQTKKAQRRMENLQENRNSNIITLTSKRPHQLTMIAQNKRLADAPT